MTSVAKREVVCGHCGQAQTVQVLLSTNRSGYPDLDLRPPPMMRDTLHVQVQCCSACGYCAADISKVPDAQAAVVIAGAEYLNTLQREDLPLTARQMLCRGLLEAAADQPLRAGWSVLKAAWVCDDANVAAAPWRELAASHFLRAIAADQMPCEDVGLSQALLADLWRRSGHFDKALAMAESGLALKSMVGLEGNIEDILSCQILLINQGDTECHDVYEAERAAPDWAERNAAMIAEQNRRVEAKRQEQLEQQARISPLAFVRALAALTAELVEQEGEFEHDPNTCAKHIRPWLMRLSLPPSMAAIMESNVRVYGWPVISTLAAIGLVVVERFEADSQAEFSESKATWQVLCEGEPELVDYLRGCLCAVEPLVWHYSPPKTSTVTVSRY